MLFSAAALAAVFALYRFSLMRQVARTEQRLREEGILLSTQALNDAYPRIPDEQNAALAYEEAAKSFREFRFIDADWVEDGPNFVPQHATRFTDEQLERVREFLAENEAALEICRRARRLTGARYELPSDPEAGEFERFEMLGILLGTAARFEFATADAVSAADYLEDAFALALSLTQCPNIHAQFHARVIMELIASVAFDAVTTPGPAENRITQLSQDVAAPAADAGWLLATAAGLSEAFRRTDDARAHPRNYVDDTEFIDQLLYLELPALGRVFGLLKRVLGADDQRRLNDLMALEALYERIATEPPPDWPIEEYWISYEAMDCADCFLGFVARSEALGLHKWRFETMVEVRAKRVALAVEHFRRDEKRLPYGLEELVPGYLDSIPLDPYDSKPLRMVQRTDEYTVYSVGPDRTDESGILDYSRYPHRDIGFSVPLADN